MNQLLFVCSNLVQFLLISRTQINLEGIVFFSHQFHSLTCNLWDLGGKLSCNTPLSTVSITLHNYGLLFPSTMYPSCTSIPFKFISAATVLTCPPRHLHILHLRPLPLPPLPPPCLPPHPPLPLPPLHPPQSGRSILVPILLCSDP